MVKKMDHTKLDKCKYQRGWEEEQYLQWIFGKKLEKETFPPVGNEESYSWPTHFHPFLGYFAIDLYFNNRQPTQSQS